MKKNRKKGCGCLSIILIVNIIFIPIFLFTGGCANKKTITVPVEMKVDGKTTVQTQSIEFKPYGFFTKDNKVEGIEYKVVAGNVVWGIIFSESVIVPVYLWGWKLYEPVGLKKEELKIAKPENN